MCVSPFFSPLFPQCFPARRNDSVSPMLPSVCSLFPSVSPLLPSGSSLLPSVSPLLPSVAFCLLSVAFCFLSVAFCFPSVAFCSPLSPSVFPLSPSVFPQSCPGCSPGQHLLSTRYIDRGPSVGRYTAGPGRRRQRCSVGAPDSTGVAVWTWNRRREGGGTVVGKSRYLSPGTYSRAATT